MKRNNNTRKTEKKLTFEKQTIRELKTAELEQGAGGLAFDDAIDRTEPC
jgi:hypothetical protein